MTQQRIELLHELKYKALPPIEVHDDPYADLDHCPRAINHHSEISVHYAVGDLHGSAMALIYNLIKLGFLELNSPEAYSELLRIYDTDVDKLTASDLEAFKNIINDARVNTKNSLTLIGDELADRGSNDYFTLLVLEKLSKENLDVSILLSNHGLGFLKDHFKPNYTGYSEEFSEPLIYARSLNNMHKLIEAQLLDEKEVRELVNHHYIPMLKMVDYSIVPQAESDSESDSDSELEDFIVLYTHAPVDLRFLREVAASLGVDYHDRTPENMIHTLNQINSLIASILQNTDERQQQFENILTKNDSALLKFLWQRSLGDFEELAMLPGVLDDDGIQKKGDYSIFIVHGHNGIDGLVFYDRTGKILYDAEGVAVTSPAHINLDSLFDKFGAPNSRQAQHVFFRATGLSSRQLALLPTSTPLSQKALEQEKALDAIHPTRTNRMKWLQMCNDKASDLEKMERSLSTIGANYGRTGIKIKQIYTQFFLEAFKIEAYTSIEERNRKAEKITTQIGLAVDLLDRLSKDGFLEQLDTPEGQQLNKILHVAELAVHFIDDIMQAELRIHAVEKEEALASETSSDESLQEMEQLEDSSMLDDNANFAQKLSLLYSLPAAVALCRQLNELKEEDSNIKAIRETAITLLHEAIMDTEMFKEDYENSILAISQHIDLKLMMYHAYHDDDGAIKKHFKDIDDAIKAVGDILNENMSLEMQNHMNWILERNRNLDEGIESTLNYYYELTEQFELENEEKEQMIEQLIELTNPFLPGLQLFIEKRFYQNLMQFQPKEQALLLKLAHLYFASDLPHDLMEPLVTIMDNSHRSDDQEAYLKNYCDAVAEFVSNEQESMEILLNKIARLNQQVEMDQKQKQAEKEQDEPADPPSKLNPNVDVSDMAALKKFKDDLSDIKQEDASSKDDEAASSSIKSRQ